MPTTRMQKLQSYFLLRIRRILGWAVLGGVLAAISAFSYLGFEITDMFAFLGSDEFEFSLAAMAIVILAYLFPVLVAVIIATLGGVTMGAIIGGFISILIPRRFVHIVEGLAFGVGLVFLSQFLGAGAFVTSLGLPVIGRLIVYWVIFWLVGQAFTNSLWQHMPFGLYLHDTAEAPVNLEKSQAIQTLLTNFKVGQLAIGDSKMLSYQSGSVSRITRAKIYQINVQEQLGTGHKRLATHEFSITKPDLGLTTVAYKVKFTGLSPLDWWDFWARPFAADYLTHQIANMTEEKDCSLNGRLLRKQAQRLQKKTGSPQPA